jgi:hypothetical protein
LTRDPACFRVAATGHYASLGWHDQKRLEHANAAPKAGPRVKPGVTPIAGRCSTAKVTKVTPDAVLQIHRAGAIIRGPTMSKSAAAM